MTDGAVVDFALSALAAQGAATFRRSDERPDERERTEKAIDFVALSPDDVRLGIEHTMVEPYEGFIADWNLAHDRLGPVRELTEHELPVDSVFDLSLAPGSANKVKRRDAEAIGSWIVATAVTLGLPPHHYALCPHEVCRASLTLYRWPLAEGEPTSPRLRYRIGLDLETLGGAMALRSRRAMADKLSKLDDARAKDSVGSTLLCLESADVQITDPYRLGNVLLRAAEGQPVPDFLVLVMTDAHGRPLMAWTYRADAIWLAPPRLYPV